MGCNSCGKGKGLCPVTLGLALGLTCSLAVIIWSAWVMWFGMPAFMEGHIMMQASETWSETWVRAIWALGKGFVGGFFFALIYDLLLCCKHKCCGSCDCCKK